MLGFLEIFEPPTRCNHQGCNDLSFSHEMLVNFNRAHGVPDHTEHQQYPSQNEVKQHG